MREKTLDGSRTRREFIQAVSSGLAAAAAVSSASGPLLGTALPAQGANVTWKNRIGLETYTVRDRLTSDFEGTLAEVARLGYTEIEPASGYNNMSPKDFRAMLDRLKLTMPSTHTAARGTGAELDRQLEGFQIMGLKYTEIAAAAGNGGGAPTPAPGSGAAPAAPLAPGAYFDRGTGILHNSFTEVEAFGPYQPAVTLESVKQRAAQLNANGKTLQRFGMKTFVHNHTGEFEKLKDSPRTTYDVLLAETDPELVTMQLDVGWAYIAGIDPIALFKAHPGRFELWHVKDVFGLKKVNPSLGPNDRVASMAIVPVGTGHIDFRPVFANAALAGLRHFAVEQDNAATWGDSLAAARVSYENLKKVLP
ncbi:MAG: sugar phosphate isomerase/epimerase [Acidobacteriota bacterium]